MPATDTNLAARSGNLVESHKGYDPRLVFFYFLVAGLLLTLVCGLGYQQLHLIGQHKDNERRQTLRRILYPGPRGNIYDRNGVPLVVNTPRWTVVLHLDELRPELRREYGVIQANYRKAVATKKEMPSEAALSQITRVAVAQRYLEQVNRVLGRDLQIDSQALKNHFSTELLNPFTLVDNLDDTDYARLIERLPVNSPLQVYASFTRTYPFKSAAAHVLGYVRNEGEVDAKDFPGEDLRTSRMKNIRGKAGLEARFDAELQGAPGGKILRVDPAGYKINPTVEERAPKQGKNLATSLDIDLQLAAEEAIGDQIGAAVALDANTGEVLVLASKPDYDLNDFYPRLPDAIYKAIQEKGAEFNYAISGRFPPGSTFKILTSIAGMRRGTILPDQPIIDCDGELRRYGGRFVCYNGLGHHHNVLLPQAIAESCDIFFYEAGWRTSPAEIAAEGRRFHLDQDTGLESPNETGRNLILPDPEWKERTLHQKWYPGDTANMAIGQGYVLLSPLQMACFAASVGRNEVLTRPTLLHDPNRPVQHHESIGLTAEQRAALLEGMIGCTLPPKGTARFITEMAAMRLPGINIAGKTGTAQKDVVQDGKMGKINFAWFICFAPAEKPEIAMAVMLQGENLGEEFGGGRQSGPIAAAVLKKYFDKKKQPTGAILSPFRVK